MKEALIIGKANAGKTLFMINFAEFLGARGLKIAQTAADGRASEARLATAEARRSLVDAVPHKTRALQAVSIDFPSGKTLKSVNLTDTTGLTEGIHEDPEVRRAMAQTLARLRTVDIILHIIDASKVGEAGTVEAMGEVDFQIARYAPFRGPYSILANKMDLPWSRAGIARIVERFPGQRIIPISALERRGFREVRGFVWKYA